MAIHQSETVSEPLAAKGARWGVFLLIWILVLGRMERKPQKWNNGRSFKWSLIFIMQPAQCTVYKVSGSIIQEKWYTAQWTPCPIRDTKEYFLSTHVAHCSLKGYWVNFIVLNNSLLQCIFVTIHSSRENTLGDSIYSTAIGTIWMWWFWWSSQRYQ